MTQESYSGGPHEDSQYLKRFSRITSGLKLVGDTILVEKLSAIEGKTQSGIIIPSNKQQSYKQTYNDEVIEFGVVLMVGPGDVDSEGNHLAMTTKPGDIISLPPNVQWYSQFGTMKDYKIGTIGRMRDAQVMMCWDNYNEAMEALNAESNVQTSSL